MIKLYFLRKINRPLIALDKRPTSSKYWNVLKAALTNYFEEDKSFVMRMYTHLSERQALVFYLAARIHSSFTTYYVRGCAPYKIAILLFTQQENCSDFASRMMLISDLLGIATARVAFWTPSLPGHILVEAYYTLENTAYLLDANYNIVMMQ